MKNTIGKIVFNIVIGVFIVGCICLSVYNWQFNPEFLVTPLSTILSILIAVVVSFYFVQKKTDHRRKNEKIDKLLYKIQDIILDKNFLEVKEKDLIVQRSLANKIEYLANYSDHNISSEIGKIKDKFEDYRTFYGNHYKDADYMKKSQQELLNYVRLIDDICDEIHIKLL